MSAKDAFVAKTVGTPVERIEDLRLLRGLGTYVDDLHPEGLLHASILRSFPPTRRLQTRNGRAKSVSAPPRISITNH